MHLYNALKKHPFVIAGPCVIESEELVEEVGAFLASLQKRLPGVKFIFKSSFDKANRTSLDSFRGPGLKDGLKILEKVKAHSGLPVLTDIHEPYQAEQAAKVAGILQIPAFLCRQTDLLLAAAKTQKVVNIKKGQFLSGKDMEFPADKVVRSGNSRVLLTERGNIFGYNNLTVDFRNIADMMHLGYPVVFDATHSVQRPGRSSGASGGNREYIPYLARAARAVGVSGLFFEIHPDPDRALSDGPNMLDLESFEDLSVKLFGEKR